MKRIGENSHHHSQKEGKRESAGYSWFESLRCSTRCGMAKSSTSLRTNGSKVKWIAPKTLFAQRVCATRRVRHGDMVYHTVLCFYGPRICDKIATAFLQ